MKYPITILTAVILILGFLGLGYMHEEVHVEIYKSYGIESHVEYFSHFPDLITISKEPCPTDACVLAHNINEAIGYPLQIVYGSLSLILFFIISFLEILVNKKLEEKND